MYQGLLEDGVARETARMILPLCTKTKIHMTGSIRSLMSAVHAVAAGGEYEPGNERVTEFVRLLKYWQFSHLGTHLNSSLPTE